GSWTRWRAPACPTPPRPTRSPRAARPGGGSATAARQTRRIWRRPRLPPAGLCGPAEPSSLPRDLTFGRPALKQGARIRRGAGCSRRRGGRAAEGGGLLKRYTGLNPYRGFESPPLRQLLPLVPRSFELVEPSHGSSAFNHVWLESRYVLAASDDRKQFRRLIPTVLWFDVTREMRDPRGFFAAYVWFNAANEKRARRCAFIDQLGELSDKNPQSYLHSVRLRVGRHVEYPRSCCREDRQSRQEVGCLLRT